MDHLSSCYFCGTALDRPLQTVRLADSTEGADAPALTLCPPCRRKLERVFEVAAVVAPVDLAASDFGEPEDQSDAGDDGLIWGRPGGEAEDSSSEDVTIGETPEDILEEVSPQDATAEVDANETAGAEETVDDSADAEGATDESVDANGASDDSANTEAATGESADHEETADESGEDDVTVDEADDANGSAETDDQPTARDSGATDAPAVTAAESSDTDGGTSGTTASGGDSTTRTVVGDRGGSSLSALEYNKVIRLLQNREFPVDRDEIVTIAANAYDLRRAECAAILDLAVERDVLAESDGQLYRPE